MFCLILLQTIMFFIYVSVTCDPQFPLDTGPLRCGSDPVSLCHPKIPTSCGLSPLRRSVVDSWRHKAEEFPR